MSQYNPAPLSAADNTGWDATDLELAPFLPTTNHSGASNPPAHAGAGQSVGSEVALPPDAEFVSLHGKVEFTGVAACATCATPFPTNHQLEQHAAKNKHKAYLCTCGKGFTKLSALRRHIEESTQAREHRCPLCDHKCKRPGHVEQHLRLIHKKPKDVIKDLLRTQKAQLRQGPEQPSTISAAVPATVPMVSQAGYPAVVPGGPQAWTGPIDLFATAPVDHPGSRPGDLSIFSPGLPILGAGQVTEAPAFTPQNFMMQAPGLPVYPAYPAAASAAPVAAQTGFFANPAPYVSGYPAALLDGTKDLFNVNPASVSVNPADGFGMPALEPGFKGEFYDFDFNTFVI